jgi:hypothetical protein
MRVVSLSSLAPLAAALVLAAVASAADPWTKLYRPLHLARLAAGAACPVSRDDTRVDWKRARIFGGTGIGSGPVYPGLGGTPVLEMPRDPTYGGPWHGTKVFWYVLPSYRGPVLIRGRRLDGRAWLRFEDRAFPAPELRISPGESVGWEGQPTGSRGRPSGVRARASGCYGVQIDGTSFSRVVVFRVALTT